MKPQKGVKITLEPVQYEIEILELSQEIPKELETRFTEWLSRQVDTCVCGKNEEYFCHTDSHLDDIGVRFYIKRIN